jgi:hypothetical protein
MSSALMVWDFDDGMAICPVSFDGRTISFMRHRLLLGTRWQWLFLIKIQCVDPDYPSNRAIIGLNGEERWMVDINYLQVLA